MSDTGEWVPVGEVAPAAPVTDARRARQEERVAWAFEKGDVATLRAMRDADQLPWELLRMPGILEKAIINDRAGLVDALFQEFNFLPADVIECKGLIIAVEEGVTETFAVLCQRVGAAIVKLQFYKLMDIAMCYNDWSMVKDLFAYYPGDDDGKKAGLDAAHVRAALPRVVGYWKRHCANYVWLAKCTGMDAPDALLCAQKDPQLAAFTVDCISEAYGASAWEGHLDALVRVWKDAYGMALQLLKALGDVGVEVARRAGNTCVVAALCKHVDRVSRDLVEALAWNGALDRRDIFRTVTVDGEPTVLFDTLLAQGRAGRGEGLFAVCKNFNIPFNNSVAPVSHADQRRLLVVAARWIIDTHGSPDSRNERVRLLLTFIATMALDLGVLRDFAVFKDDRLNAQTMAKIKALVQPARDAWLRE